MRSFLLSFGVILFIAWVGCKSQQKEPPYEFITFFPSVSTLNPSDGIHEVNMKRYLSESIEDMMIRMDTLFGMKLLGRWIGNDSIVFNRIDSNTFTVDTIQRAVMLPDKSRGITTWTDARNSIRVQNFTITPIPKHDTVYIYRDTCVGLNGSSYHNKITYALAVDSTGMIVIVDTIKPSGRIRLNRY